MTNLTEAQRIVLTEMEAKDLEAIRFEGEWWFRGDIRKCPEMAERMVRADAVQSCPAWPAARPRTMEYKWLMSITR
jgi:hypothetical protein